MSSDQGLIWFYGDYEHPAGEVYPKTIEILPKHSDKGVRWASFFRMEVAGSFVGTNPFVDGPELTPAQVDARIIEMEAEYLNDYKDCGFKLKDGTPTEHYMTNNDPFNLSGNKIMHRSWDNQYPTEFANTRSFSITIESLFLQSYNPIVYFHETTQRIGTGGPVWALHNNWGEDPEREEIFTKSKVTHVTRGTIVGLTARPTIPPPLWPEEEQEWKREVSDSSPQFHGDLSFTKGTHYVRSYAYYFERIGPDPTPSRNWYNG